MHVERRLKDKAEVEKDSEFGSGKGRKAPPTLTIVWTSQVDHMLLLQTPSFGPFIRIANHKPVSDLTNMAAPSIARSSCFRATTQLTRVFNAPAPTKAFFTTSSAPLKQLRSAYAPAAALPSIASKIPTGLIAAQCKSQFTRQASTSSSNAPATPAPEILTWNRFFDLRRKRRFINLGASIITALTAVGFAAPIIANQDIDTWGAQISGMDPFIVLGVTTFTVAIAGWMCGPSFGTAGFKLWAGRRGWNTAIAQVGDNWRAA